MKKASLSIATMLLMFMACEQVIELGTLPFEEKLVVRAVLQADSAVEAYFTRTFSLNETYSTDQGAISNVSAFIVSEGVSYPLTYAGQLIKGNFRTGFARYTADSLIARGGKSYELFASWSGHSIQAHTHVPDSATIDRTYLDPSNVSGQSYFLMTQIRSQNGTVYTADYEVVGTFQQNSVFGAGLIKPDIESKGVVLQVFIGTSYPSAWRDSLYSKVTSFDEPFFDYYRSRRNSRPGSGAFNIFGSPGPVFWNVDGEALGLFIGMNVTRKKVQVF